MGPIATLLAILRRLFNLILAPFTGLIGAEKPDEFLDPVRRRRIPYKVYEPADLQAPAPVVLFSHGMGGTREAAPYLGRALAAAGYWGIFLQHPGSDASELSALRSVKTQDEKMKLFRRAMLNPEARRDRFLDVPFVLDRLAALNADPASPWAGKLDLSRVGMAGHSYGARTTMAAAGQHLPGAGLMFKEPRIRAGLLLSPSGARLPGAAEARANAAEYKGIHIPLLHVTGTRDSDPASRILPYKNIQVSNQYLLVLDGATHGDLSAASRRSELQEPPGPDRDRVTEMVALAAVLFFDAYLKGSEGALTALREEFPAHLKPTDRFEFK